MYLPVCPRTRVLLILVVISLAFLIFSITLILNIFPRVIKNELYKHVTLIKHSDQFDRFVELPFPVMFKVYFFNVENPEDVLTGSKPILKEVGPYVYQQFRKKNIIHIDDTGDSISYTQRESFKFDSNASGGLSDEDNVTVLNALFMGGLQDAEKTHLTGLLSPCLHDIFPDLDRVFVTAKVKSLLFDGLQFCPEKASLSCVFQKVSFCLLAETKRNVDKLNGTFLTFSLFNYKARSDDGVYTIKRGLSDVDSLGTIVSINNATYTQFWDRLSPNSTCDHVGGGDGTLYPPGIGKEAVFETYSTDICRSVKVSFLKETTYKGVKGYMFSTDNATLRASTANKEDDCFCANETRGVDGEDECFLDGVIDVEPCIGAPILLSFPHFLWADRKYGEAVIGLSPNEDLHRTYVTVEPETGIPLEGMKRVQLNSVLRPIKSIERTQKLPRLVLPIVWIEEGISLGDTYINELNEMYFDKVRILDISQWTLLGVSSVTAVIFSASFVYKRCFKEE